MSSSSNSRSETARSARAQWPPNTAAWMDEHAKKDPPVMVHPLSVHHWNVGWHRSKYPNRPFDSHYYPFDYMEKAKEHKRLTMRHQATNAPMPPIISPEQVAAYDAMIKNGVEKGHFASKSSFLARMTRLFRNKQPWATQSRGVGRRALWRSVPHGQGRRGRHAPGPRPAVQVPDRPESPSLRGHVPGQTRS